ncbi:MAG: hypothetical protein ACFCBV_07345 [Phycisphaerales bacterium]
MGQSREPESASLDARVRELVAKYLPAVTYQNAPEPNVDYDAWYRGIARQLGWPPTNPRFWVEICDTFAAGGFTHPESHPVMYLLRLHGAPLAAWSTTRDYGRRVRPVQAPEVGYTIDYAGVDLIEIDVLSYRFEFREWIDFGCSKGELGMWFGRHSRPSVAEVFFSNYD